jgi:uncharacterized protein (TIGR00251 family)
VVQLTIRVIPRASKPGIAGTRQGALLVRLQSPPVEGAANSELVELVASTFGVAKRDVTIVAGERSKLKRVLISTLDRTQADTVLRTLGIRPETLSSS